MPSKPLAAKASVFNGNFVDDVASTVATEPDFTDSHRDRFYNDFSKMLAQGIVGLLLSCSMATSWAWRMHLGFVRTSPAKEMSSTRLRQGHRHQPLLRQQPGRMVPAPPTSLPRLPPLRQLEGAEAGTGDPAPVDSASRAPCAALRLVTSQAAAAVKNKASMSFSKALCARFEH